MKSKILKVLKTSNSVVSGEQLSKQLGTSRVSVWKHVKKLQELGYDIVSSATGYQLFTGPDTPFSWEFPGFEDRIFYFDEVDSTMDMARNLARKEAVNLTVVVADRQSKGRGRLNRQWVSETGGLYFTTIIKPELVPAMSIRINFSASLVLVKIIRQLYAIDARVKWPNDILVENQKLSGVLSEMETESEMVKYINLGIGINVNNDPRIAEPRSTSLSILLNRQVSRVELLNRFLNDFEPVVMNIESEDIISMWKRYSGTLNRHVRIVTTHEQIEGYAMDVDETGALVMKLSDGSVRRVLYGDCFYH